MTLPAWQGCLKLWAGSAPCPARVTPREQGINVAFGSALPLAGQCSWAGMEVAQEFISGKDHKQMERLRVKGGSKGGIMTQRDGCLWLPVFPWVTQELHAASYLELK